MQKSSWIVQELWLDSGDHLLSQAAAHQVPSTAWVLTVVFGMGTGVSPKRIITGNLFYSGIHLQNWIQVATFQSNFTRSSPRSISIGQLNTLPCLHLQPINLVIFKGSYFIKNGKSYLEGGFTLRCLQRLSVPYIATRLCSWSATGTPEVRPSRSSRTKDSSSQISCAHNG